MFCSPHLHTVVSVQHVKQVSVRSFRFSAHSSFLEPLSIFLTPSFPWTHDNFIKVKDTRFSEGKGGCFLLPSAQVHNIKHLATQSVFANVCERRGRSEDLTELQPGSVTGRRRCSKSVLPSVIFHNQRSWPAAQPGGQDASSYRAEVLRHTAASKLLCAGSVTAWKPMPWRSCRSRWPRMFLLIV